MDKEPRIILHVDLDSFFASVEERLNPELAGKAVVVCVYSGRTGDSGAVATSNYKARELGIKSGMPISAAKRLGKDKAVFIPTRIGLYGEFSERVMGIMKAYADRFEQVSIDEAYLDVSDRCDGFGEAEGLAGEIKKAILEGEGLTCSVGIGKNKLTAKMASRLRKPDGLTIVPSGDFGKIFHDMPVKKLHGVGDKAVEVFERLGIRTIGQLASFDTNALEEFFGKARGQLLHNRANGMDEEPVEESDRQQISRLATLKENTRDMKAISELLERLAEDVHRKLAGRNLEFRTISIITITPRLETRTKSRTLGQFAADLGTIRKHSIELMQEFLEKNPDEELRRCGVRVSNFPETEVPKEQRTLGGFLGKG